MAATPGPRDPGSIRRWASRHCAGRCGGDRFADDAGDDLRLREHQEVRGTFDLRHRGARAVVLKNGAAARPTGRSPVPHTAQDGFARQAAAVAGSSNALGATGR